jgi:hypothetical protein
MNQQNKSKMKKELSAFVALLLFFVSYVVAFVRTVILKIERIDHSGLKTFSGKVQSVAVEVRLRFNAWLSGLQHSPTV